MRRELLSMVATAALIAGTSTPFAQDAASPAPECPPGQECPQPGAPGDQPAAAPDSQTGQPAADQGAMPQDPSGADAATAEQPGEEPAQTGSIDPALDLPDEQQTELRTAVTEVGIEPMEDVNFNISIGATIPQTVVLHPLPPRFVKVVPAYTDYRFFVLADGTIIIVDPDSWRIVYVLYA